MKIIIILLMFFGILIAQQPVPGNPDEIKILQGKTFLSDIELIFFCSDKERSLYTNSILEFINCPTSSSGSCYIGLILDKFSSLLKKESFLWINSVTGMYKDSWNSSLLSDPSLMDHMDGNNPKIEDREVITVTDVLIDGLDVHRDGYKTAIKIYYTFNGKFYSYPYPYSFTEGDKNRYQEYINKYSKKKIVDLTVSLSVLA